MLQRPVVACPSKHGDVMGLIFAMAMDGYMGNSKAEASADIGEGAASAE